MRIPSRATTGDVGFNMTPMIDVVFQLIIFFLLSSHLAKQETQLALPLPRADSGQASADNDQPRVTVNVLADGTLLVAGRPVSTEELAAYLRERQGAHGGGLEVRIRADRSVPYRFVEPIMLACARAGIWNVAYSVSSREEER
ncbi:MAG: biopolymer transporter ExbD [Pirellulaceae bacterium]